MFSACPKKPAQNTNKPARMSTISNAGSMRNEMVSFKEDKAQARHPGLFSTAQLERNALRHLGNRAEA